MTLSFGFLSLEQLAADGGEARDLRGRCFDATLQLGREALRLSVAQRLTFVRWRVRNDPDFLEHWALALDDGQVLDPTAAQVDSDPRALRRMDEYPANYVRPRRYPVAELVSLLATDAPAHGWRFSRRQVWRLHRWLFRHDARQAVARRSSAALFAACGALCRSAVTLVIDTALERAVRRLGTLIARRGDRLRP